MASLVADYSSESDDDEGLSGVSKDQRAPEKLPSPKFVKEGAELPESSSRSVFSNPYREAEEAQKSLLEKHVKMTSVDKQNTLNGRQICWNFRKGKCRFGHNCKFAHDSDAPLNPGGPAPFPPATPEEKCRRVAAPGRTKKKKRPGLAAGLIPSKKAMKMYARHNASLSKV